MRSIVILVAILSMTACAAPPGDEANPTVTYRYAGDLYGLRFEEISEEAYAYCAEQFGRRSQLQEADGTGEENRAVFACI